MVLYSKTLSTQIGLYTQRRVRTSTCWKWKTEYMQSDHHALVLCTPTHALVFCPNPVNIPILSLVSR
jgi:hypothetical protein